MQSQPSEVTQNAAASAKQAKLRYVSDDAPGIRRKRSGKGFTYIDADGNTVRDEKIIQRIKQLTIPPAWKDVWICSHSNGHIQATGLDEKARKQYRYHERWRQVRDETKYARLMLFGASLPKIRRRVEADLKRPGLPREKVLAAVVKLLEKTAIRVGNEEYARTNKSFGLTTMKNRHAKIEGAHLIFNFKGKSGVRHSIDLNDRRLAKIVAQTQDLPGQDLFEWADKDGTPHTISSADVNDYSARNFRRRIYREGFSHLDGNRCRRLSLAGNGSLRFARRKPRKTWSALSKTSLNDSVTRPPYAANVMCIRLCLIRI